MVNSGEHVSSYSRLGLDASTARNVIQCLSTLSRGGRMLIYFKINFEILKILIEGTIIFSVHQPRYSIFRLFDTVLLMCNGECVYHGSSKQILSYFNNQGYQCELHDNPADFALDVLIDVQQNENDVEKLYKSYKRSSMYKRLIDHINQQLLREHAEKSLYEQKSVVKRSLGREIYHLSTRTLTNTFRNPQLFFSEIISAIILSLLAGLVFYDMKRTVDPGISNRFGSMFFIAITQVFGAVTSLEPLINDRILFVHVNQ